MVAIGIDEKTFQIIEGNSELKQRLQRCMKTRRGTVPIDREWGSNLPDKVDKKITPELAIDIYADVADMIAHPPNGFSDEIKLMKTYFEAGENEVSLTVEVERLYDGKAETITGLTL